MELLLVTARWPLSDVHEFLNDEIHHLSDRFSRIIVAPLRPTGPQRGSLPKPVTVDRSLADSLTRLPLGGRLHSRAAIAGARAWLPNPVGGSWPRAFPQEPSRDAIRWYRALLLSRADARSVGLWAASRKPPDLAYSFWLNMVPAALRAAWPNTPIVSRAHGGDVYSEAHGWQSIPFQERSLEACTLVAAVSQSGADYLRDKFPEYADRIRVRTLGIPDLGGLATASPGAELRLLSASSIDANKRVDLIFDVVCALAQEGRNVAWTHIGTGPDAPALLARVGNAPPSLRVRLMGQIPPEQVRSEVLNGGYHAFINLSLSEGASVALMEAQCVGLPVVATAVGGTPEVAPPACNELVPASEPAPGVASAVLRAAQRPELQRRTRRQHWEDHYNERTTYARWSAELVSLAVRR